MQRRIFTGLCAAAAVIGTLYTTAWYKGYNAFAETSAEKHFLFSSLSSADEMMALDVTQRGCFHQSRYRLQYSPIPSPRVTVFVQKDKGVLGSRLEALGTVILTRAQLERLDNRLRFYRGKRSDGCTNRDSVTLTAFRGGKIVRSETFDDSSCSIETFADADSRDIQNFPQRSSRFTDARPVLSLNKLFEISIQSQKQGKPLPYQDLPRQKTAAWEAIQSNNQDIATKKSSRKVMYALPGFAEINAKFVVSGEDHRFYSPYGDSFSVDLAPRGNRMIDNIYWYNATKNDKPMHDWHTALTAIDKVERRVQKISWLSEWKAKNPTHKISVTLVGKSLINESLPYLYVYPPWRHARLKGKPVYELTLRWGKESDATILLSEEDNRALITSASLLVEKDAKLETEPGTWFSRLSLMYHPSEKVPEYAIVEADGTGKQNVIPDKTTPIWFEGYMNRQREQQ